MVKSDKLLMGYRLNEPEMDVMNTVYMTFAADVIDMTNKVIVEAVVNAAKEAGITQLYLLDKDFILDAIRAKLDAKMDGGTEC